MNGPLKSVEILGLLAACALSQLVFAAYAPWALYIDFPLTATLYIGWHSHPVRGAACGTLLGLAQDVTQVTSYLGLNGFSKTLAGFLASYLSKWMVSEAFPVRAATAMAVSLLDSGTVFALLQLFGQPGRSRGLSDTLLQALVTGVGTAFFFRAYDRVKFPEKDFRRAR